MIPSMVVPSVAALVAFGFVGCIQANRPRFVEDTADIDVQDVDVVQETTIDSTPLEVEVEVGECGRDADCAQPPGMCDEAVCANAFCITQPKANNAPCDDGDPCTADGACQTHECIKGRPVVDGTPCDEDDLVCNGSPTCEDGRCVFALPPTCDDSGAQCADGAVCSEELGGQCVDLPAADGLACDGPTSSTGAPAAWACSVGKCVPPDMVFVGGGIFSMGCPDVEHCSNDDTPVYEVRLSPFAIDRTEVSEAEFTRCREDLDNRGFRCAPRPNEGAALGGTQGDSMPLRWIDWSRAETVCAYQEKRLCTEAEWEYAARGVGNSFYPWGNLPPTCERATFFDEGGPGCNTGMPSLVGAKPLGASTFKVLEMAGNVSEWCADYYRAEVYAERAGATAVDPIQSTLDKSDSHVVRGGSFRDGVAPIRVFVRSAESSQVYDDDLGTRCCLSLTGP